MFTRERFKKAVIAFLLNNMDQYKRYRQVCGDNSDSVWSNDNLIAVVVSGMQNTLPTVIAAGITFNRLVADGTIKRTDGRTNLDDANDAVEATKRNFDRVVAEVEAPPLSAKELEVFYSMHPRERALHYWAGDPPGYNSFRIRFDKAIKEHGFEQPAQTWTGS